MQIALPAVLMSALLLGGGGPSVAQPATSAALFSTAPVDQKSCPATPYQVLGQAWRSDFSTGGLMPDAAQLPADTFKPPTMAAVFPGLSPIPETGQKTAVIVLDRFQTTPVQVNSDAPAPWSPRSVQLSLDVRHGALVVQHLRAMLESDGFGPPTMQPGPAGDIGRLIFTRGSQSVTVAPLDITTVDGLTRPTAERFGALVKSLEQAGHSTILVNLSFVLMSCRALRDIEARKAQLRAQTALQPVALLAQPPAARPPARYTLESYLKEAAGGQKSAEDLRAEVFGTGDLYPNGVGRSVPDIDASVTNPLLRALLLAQNSFTQPGRQFVMVGAAGNYGQIPYLMPGALTSLVSVGATTWDSQAPGLSGEKGWSNYGDVSAVGEWFTLPQETLTGLCTGQPSDPWCVASPTALKDWPKFAYRGTSFSAPSVTALLASRLLPSHGPECLPTARGLQNGPVNISCFQPLAINDR